MKSLVFFSVIVGLVMFNGCKESFLQPDLTAPAAPRGLWTATGDNEVTLSWYANTEPDVAGYHVFVSTSYIGKYVPIGTTSGTSFLDRGSRNGDTYYYAVSAYDFAGNESDLSPDLAFETPRPEGYDVNLFNYRTTPSRAGYDFSTYSVGQYDDRYTDVYFEYDRGLAYADVWDDTEIQDAGYTTSLYDVGFSPEAGWSPSKDAVLIKGHTYVVRTWDNHYAKFRVVALSPAAMIFDWSYQLQEGNTRLKVTAARPSLHAGSGISSRSLQN